MPTLAVQAEKQPLIIAGAYSPASSRVDGFKCRNRLVNTVALRTKFRKNPNDVHDGLLGPGRSRATVTEVTASRPRPVHIQPTVSFPEVRV